MKKGQLLDLLADAYFALQWSYWPEDKTGDYIEGVYKRIADAAANEIECKHMEEGDPGVAAPPAQEGGKG